MTEKVVIIGSGPAGYTAAIYATRDALDPILIRGFEAGGQLMLTSEVENFPAFKSILGPDLMDSMYEQVKALGCRVVDGNVTKVDLGTYPYRIWAGDKEYQTYSIIIATGASAKWLGLEKEKELIGKGVSGCAVCDGPFFRNKDVVVVGGGDSAMEDALYLSTLTKSVTLVHRRKEFRASKIMQERVFANKKIRVIFDSEVTRVLGDGHVTGVEVTSKINGEKTHLKTDGLFIAIGHYPNTDLFKGQLDIDENGYVVTHDSVKTSREGVFAAGDVQDRVYKQAVIAAGWGSMAAIDARKFLEEKKLA